MAPAAVARYPGRSEYPPQKPSFRRWSVRSFWWAMKAGTMPRVRHRRRSAVTQYTDFFMPIVDDPFSFGRIAAVICYQRYLCHGEALPDGIAILGWPLWINLPPKSLPLWIEGGRYACGQARNSPWVGGTALGQPGTHLRGLAVYWNHRNPALMKNNTATPVPGCTSPSPGRGHPDTAQKRGILAPEHQQTSRILCVRSTFWTELAKN
jgi:selenide,water dikinase